GPGIIIAICLGIFVFVIAKKRKYKVHPKCSLRERFQWFRKSFWALLMIVIILGGISCGIFTPTEASCIAIAYCIIIVCFVYREMPFSNILNCMGETVTGIVPALAIVSSASLFGWVLQFEHLGKLMLNGMLSLTENKWIILLLIDVILLFFGMILDSTPTILLLVPIFQPLVQQLGISEIHLGIVVILNLMIGLMTPPYGQSLFMLAGATKTPFNKVVSYVLPWLLPLSAALMLITFFPQICLFLPRLLGMDV
ncbi:MAG TPA: TRAP transporter large permease, partial [Lachnospiraceae bacterium]|nr:TRAP transporter large permease [Lachnospiraceae bacterium]